MTAVAKSFHAHQFLVDLRREVSFLAKKSAVTLRAAGYRAGRLEVTLFPEMGVPVKKAKRLAEPSDDISDIGLLTVAAQDLLDDIYVPTVDYRELRVICDELR